MSFAININNKWIDEDHRFLPTHLSYMRLLNRLIISLA